MTMEISAQERDFAADRELLLSRIRRQRVRCFWVPAQVLREVVLDIGYTIRRENIDSGVLGNAAAKRLAILAAISAGGSARSDSQRIKAVRCTPSFSAKSNCAQCCLRRSLRKRSALKPVSRMGLTIRAPHSPKIRQNRVNDTQKVLHPTQRYAKIKKVNQISPGAHQINVSSALDLGQSPQKHYVRGSSHLPQLDLLKWAIEISSFSWWPGLSYRPSPKRFQI